MYENVRVLVDLRDRTLQKNRIAFGNRMVAIKDGNDSTNDRSYKLIEKWYNLFYDLEKDIDKDLADMIEDVEIIERLTDLKGIGPILASELVGMIDIERSPTVSSLWRYAGLGVVEGRRERNKKGESAHKNKLLKSLVVYKVGGSFMRSNSPYKKIYDSSKEYYQINRPDWINAHCHNAAIDKMVKLFLSHLWLVWREIEGLPTRNLYVEEYKGHTHIIPPQEMGWRDWK